MKKTLLIITALTFSIVSCTKKSNGETQNTPTSEKQNIDVETTINDQENEPFSQITLNKEFDDLKGNKISFQDILKQHQGRPIVIDVWASWCPDCIKGFPELKELQAKYPETAYVLLSLDRSKDKWLNAIEKYELVGDHYYLEETMKGEFGTSINLDWIPRYIVADAQGNIALKKAIVANDSLLIDTLEKLHP